MMFLYIAKKPATILGINTNGASLTLYHDNHPHSMIIIQGYFKYIHKSKAFAEMGFQVKTVVSNPEAPIHRLTHPCKDPLRNASHIHVVFTKFVTPELIQLYIDAMTELEESPALRTQFLKPHYILTLIEKWGDYVSPPPIPNAPFNSDLPILLLDNTDKNSLGRNFNKAYDEGLLTTNRLPLMESNNPLRFYVQPPNVTACSPHYLPSLTNWQREIVDDAPAALDRNVDRMIQQRNTISASAVLATCCLMYCYCCKKANDEINEQRERKVLRMHPTQMNDKQD